MPSERAFWLLCLLIASSSETPVTQRKDIGHIEKTCETECKWDMDEKEFSCMSEFDNMITSPRRCECKLCEYRTHFPTFFVCAVLVGLYLIWPSFPKAICKVKLV